jgi:hypothetical protein
MVNDNKPLADINTVEAGNCYWPEQPVPGTFKALLGDVMLAQARLLNAAPRRRAISTWNPHQVGHVQPVIPADEGWISVL